MLDLEFKLMPSKQYIICISVLILSSSAIVLGLPAAIWLKIISLLGVFSYGGYIVWYFGLSRSQHAILSIRRLSNGSWQITTARQTYQAELLGDSTVNSVVSILRFRTIMPEQLKTCIVLRDSLAPNRYRQLLVALTM